MVTMGNSIGTGQLAATAFSNGTPDPWSHTTNSPLSVSIAVHRKPAGQAVPLIHSGSPSSGKSTSVNGNGCEVGQPRDAQRRLQFPADLAVVQGGVS